MQSSRLPKKVLADINGVPAIGRILRRLRLCTRLDGLVLATTTRVDDDALVSWAKTQGILHHRGSEEDVLRRVVEAHLSIGTDIIVEVCGDTPLIDPNIIDLAIDTFIANPCDVVSTTWKPSYPQGIDAQVFSLNALREIDRRTCDPAIREHVSLFFYEHPDDYRIIHLEAPQSSHAPDLRFQLDYPEDLVFVREVYSRLEPYYGDAFGTAEILNLLRTEPNLLEINRYCSERKPRA
tara:strand:+ start:388 stop:1098 length:711 start_codon:yes stop_codon:yes gene_type:complete